MTVRPPYPYPGGKSRVAGEIWRRLGNPSHYVEPFFGGGATLLLRPGGAGTSEVVNDLDCMIPNFWRAVAADPEAVAHYADWPISEADLLARHRWLRDRKPSVREAITSDPEYFDAKIAGWWVWGISQWIGSGWCKEDPDPAEDGGGVSRHPGGVCGKHLSVQKARGTNGHGRGGVSHHPMGVLASHGKGGMRSDGRTGILRTRVGGKPAGANGQRALVEWIQELSARMRRVRILCGDFERVLSAGQTSSIWPTTGLLLDPPYDPRLRRGKIYNQDSEDVAVRARRWALENGDNPKFRIVLAGYPEEHSELEEAGWKRWDWTNAGGMSPNARTESLFCSPHCLEPDWRDRVRREFLLPSPPGGLFDDSAGEEATC